jgi:hypothetical protein
LRGAAYETCSMTDLARFANEYLPNVVGRASSNAPLASGAATSGQPRRCKDGRASSSQILIRRRK